MPRGCTDRRCGGAVGGEMVSRYWWRLVLGENGWEKWGFWGTIVVDDRVLGNNDEEDIWGTMVRD